MLYGTRLVVIHDYHCESNIVLGFRWKKEAGTVGERTIVVDHLKFSYEGLFNLPELYNLISGFFFDKGYDWNEKINQEMITPDGKQIRLVFEPWKNSSDYYKIIIRVKVHCTDVKDVEIEQEGRTLRLNQGLVHILFDAHVMADRHGKWEGKPFLWFLNVFMQKYFFDEHWNTMRDWVASDVDDLHHKIKDYLNVFKYAYQK